jgi:hypothetical protein
LAFDALRATLGGMPYVLECVVYDRLNLVGGPAVVKPVLHYHAPVLRPATMRIGCCTPAVIHRENLWQRPNSLVVVRSQLVSIPADIRFTNNAERDVVKLWIQDVAADCLLGWFL